MAAAMSDGPVQGVPSKATIRAVRSRQLLSLAAALVFLLIAARLVWSRTGATIEAVRRAAGEGSVEHRAASVALAFRGHELEPPDGQGTADFEVADSESLASVAGRLESDGLIRSADAFLLLAGVRGLDRGVQAGVHVLPRGAPAEDVLVALQSARNRGISVTIPEGRRAEEVAALLKEAGLPGAAGFLDVARSPAAVRSADYGVVSQRPPGAGLEGYLFPDTYDIAPEASAENMVSMFALNFVKRYEALDGEADREGLTTYDVVTLASIVEREATLASERPRIGRVFRNRLDEPPYLLGADPTVQYALGLQMSPLQWWKRPLTLEDLRNPSPYNTYVHPGLPPGPIANAGLASLESVVRAEDGPWMYFVANEEACDGSHVFAETFDEHQANVSRYRTGACVP